MLTCAQRSGAAVAPIAVEPAAAPVPPDAAPVEATDAQAAIGVAVDRTPEEDRFAFPLLRNEVRIGKIEIEKLGTVNRRSRKLYTKLVAIDVLPILLPIIEMEFDLCGVKLHLAADSIRQLFRSE